MCFNKKFPASRRDRISMGGQTHSTSRKNVRCRPYSSDDIRRQNVNIIAFSLLRCDRDADVNKKES